MASLSRSLQAVIELLPQSIPLDLISAYKLKISKNADAFDKLEVNAGGANSADSATRACNASRILFGDRAVFPQETSYNAEQQKNWSTTCFLPAACFVKVQNAVELALALMVITITQSKFAIRSVGHNSNPGFSSIGVSGILLDLGALNDITLSSNGDVVSVGPGATWDMVYEELEKHQLTVVGGRASGVGVGGLITGGGMSHFSNYWGMACDNVKNFEVVLADSTIVQASAEDNSDLFRALKGGSSNFGIVTRFDLYTNQNYRVWYTVKVYNASDSERVMKGSVEIQLAMESDDRVGFFLSVNAGSLVAGMLYRGECTTVPSVFHVFDDITPMAIAVPETNGTQFSASKALSMGGHTRAEFGGITVRPDEDIYLKLHKIISEIGTSTNSTPTLSIQPIGASAVKAGQERGGNSMNIPPEPQSWLAVGVQWSEDTYADLARAQFRQLMSSIESTAKARGLLMDFQFLNDAFYTQSPLKGYGEESLASLSAASRRWDPKGIFQKLQNSGFLLSKLDK